MPHKAPSLLSSSVPVLIGNLCLVCTCVLCAFACVRVCVCVCVHVCCVRLRARVCARVFVHMCVYLRLYFKFSHVSYHMNICLFHRLHGYDVIHATTTTNSAPTSPALCVPFSTIIWMERGTESRIVRSEPWGHVKFVNSWC